MNDTARKQFLAVYERRMLTLVSHPLEGRRVPWRQVLTIQARHLADVFCGREPDYRPVVWR